MRIALTHNLQRGNDEAQAEFDSPETIAALVANLERLGHEVIPVEVSGPLETTLARLRAARPDLVFNTAEGHAGRHREALFPALFEELGLSYTGSDATTCALTLDKQLTKQLVAPCGVRVAPGRLVTRTDPRPWTVDFDFPVIVKPNCEGSSKGIHRDSIVHEPAELERVVERMLDDYPDGVLVESFVRGRDVTVPWLELVGSLTPAAYGLGKETADEFAIYEYDFKQARNMEVTVLVPAPLDAATLDEILRMAQLVVTTLGIRDVARLDFRVTPDGVPFFLEVNALPSFEPGGSLFRSAELMGIGGEEAVLETIVRSATTRNHTRRSVRTSRRRARRVGLVYNLRRIDPAQDDSEAEFDGARTIAALAGAIARGGHEVVELEANPSLALALSLDPVDVLFNMAEGTGGRGRESRIPALLDLLGVPYTGSDPVALALALDKAVAKSVVRDAGVLTPEFAVVRHEGDHMPVELGFPLIVKPVAEGSSKGIGAHSVVRDPRELEEAVVRVLERYGQPALVERFLPGREFTIGIIAGQGRLPPLEVVFSGEATHPVYGFSEKFELGEERVRCEVPARTDAALTLALHAAAERAFEALGCRDYARVDLRLDGDGRPGFIECNPLPGLAPDWSDMSSIAKAAGLDYDALIAAILAPALARAAGSSESADPRP